MRKGAAALGRCDVMAGKYCAYFSPLGFRRRSAGRSDGTCALRCKQGSTVMQGSSETVVSGQPLLRPLLRSDVSIPRSGRTRRMDSKAVGIGGAGTLFSVLQCLSAASPEIRGKHLGVDEGVTCCACAPSAIEKRH